MAASELDNMTAEELREAAIAEAEASSRDDGEPIHDDVPDCPKCGSSATGVREGFSGEVNGCNDCLNRWD